MSSSPLNFTVGPLVFATAHALFAMSFAVAAAVGHWYARRKDVRIVDALINMLLVALLVARLAFVVRWFDIYREDPVAIIDIRDGGFLMWPGLVAAGLYGVVRGWKQSGLRQPLAVSVLAGSLAWFMSGAPAVLTMSTQKTVPAVTVLAMNGTPASLASIAGGRPMVVNLWATWCPPCKAEMPVLAQAQAAPPGIAFVFLNQGENAGAVEKYLAGARLDLDNALLDPAKNMGQAVGSMALPTTLFYDAEGRLVTSHMGMLSAATLKAKLVEIERAANEARSQP